MFCYFSSTHVNDKQLEILADALEGRNGPSLHNKNGEVSKSFWRMLAKDLNREGPISKNAHEWLRVI